MQLGIERGELLRALGHVTSVVERRTTIPILSNVLLKTSERALQFKATDLEREVSDEAPADISQPGAVTVPAHMLHDIVRKLPDGAQVELKRDPEKERLTLRSGQSRFQLQTLAPEDFPDLAAGEFGHKITLASKLIDGTFPDYGRVIPKANDKKLKVSNAEFVSAVDRVSTIASERGRAVKLNISADKLVLSVNNPEGGSATEEISAEYDSTPLEIGFNARYLLDIAGQLESETAQFQLADPGSPTMVKDEGDEGALYVLMPMRV